MPDPDRLLNTLHRALEAIQNTPGRRGRLVQLSEVEEVLVAGDLHGNLENFRQLLTLAELAQHPRRHFVLQEAIHGKFPYPSGGDRSHQLVDLIAALKCQHPHQVHFLPGNHELAQWTERKIGKGDLDLNEVFSLGVETAYGRRAPDIYAAYLELFRAAPLALRTPNRVFLSHSLPSATRLESFDPALLERDSVEESELLPGGSVYSLLWGRDTRQSTAEAFLEKVDADFLISGHIPCERGWEAPNNRQIILDSLGTPAAYCLFPAETPLTFEELCACVKIL